MHPNEIAVTVEQDRAVVALSGEHEAYSADKLERQLAGLIAEGMAIAIDLRHAQFIDSTVVGTLIGARRRATDAGLDFSIELGETTGWPVRRLLEVVGLTQHLDIPG